MFSLAKKSSSARLDVWHFFLHDGAALEVKKFGIRARQSITLSGPAATKISAAIPVWVKPVHVDGTYAPLEYLAAAFK